MGFLLSNFSDLSELMDREQPDNTDDLYKKFQKCTLYALVLCKHEDDEFIKCMSRQFETLHMLTGNNLLFFSLADPNSTAEIQRNSWNPEVTERDNEKYDIDEDIYLYVLSETLKVSISDFPSIILTDSLESTTWYVLNTDRSHVFGDLATFAGFANLSGFEIKNIEERLNNLILDSGRSWYMVEGKIPLCDSLAAVKAAVATHSIDRDKSRKAEKTLNEVERRLLASEEKESYDLVKLCNFIRKSDQESDPKEYLFTHDNYDYNIMESLWEERINLEPDTICFLDVYDKLLTMYSENLLKDHSVLCSLTHKIFESELNASVLQLMRAFIHIPMPEYYNKWYDKAENRDAYNVTTANGSAVSLNTYIKGNPRKYRSPGLGNTCYAFQALCACKEWNELCSQFGFEESKISLFSHLWENIFKDRNSESHCTSMRRHDYQRLTDNVNQVLKLFLSNMIRIKKSLRQ